MSDSNTKRPRTIAVSFPHTEEGDRIYKTLLALKHEEDRSCSKIIYRMIRDNLGVDVHTEVTGAHHVRSESTEQHANGQF